MSTEKQISLKVIDYEDDNSSILSLRGEDGNFIDPKLEKLVADAIRQYPNTDAPSWLSPVAAILVVEQWIIKHNR